MNFVTKKAYLEMDTKIETLTILPPANGDQFSMSVTSEAVSVVVSAELIPHSVPSKDLRYVLEEVKLTDA